MRTTDSLNTWLAEISRYPLLTRDQEILLARQIQDWLANPGNAAIADRGSIAKDKLVKHNLRWVVKVVKIYGQLSEDAKHSMDTLDLIQVGSIGLAKAAERFDPTKGYRFSTYSFWWIRQAITREIATHSRSVTLPVHINDHLSKIRIGQRELTQMLGRNPSRAELAEHLNKDATNPRARMSVDRLNALLDCSKAVTRLDRLAKNDLENDTPIGDLIASDVEGPEDFVRREEMRSALRRVLSHLSEQDQQALILRYCDGFTNQEVADMFGLTRTEVQRLVAKAMRRTRAIAPRYLDESILASLISGFVRSFSDFRE